MAKRSARAARARGGRSFGPVRFVRDTVAELRRSNWPTRQETIRLTTIVVGVCIALAAFLGLFDFGMTRLADLVFE
jgi:preprotein translocase subunit SecE